MTYDELLLCLIRCQSPSNSAADMTGCMPQDIWQPCVGVARSTVLTVLMPWLRHTPYRQLSISSGYVPFLHAVRTHFGLHAAWIQFGLHAMRMHLGLHARRTHPGEHAVRTHFGLHAVRMRFGLRAAALQALQCTIDCPAAGHVPSLHVAMSHMSMC